MSEKFYYGKAKTYYTILLEAGSRDAKANPTLATGDVQISKDGGAFANLATLPTVSPASGVQVKIVLSATECQAKDITIRFKDQTATAEWEEQTIIFELVDAREGKVCLNTTTLVDRTGPNSGQITRAGYPNYIAIFTSDSSGGSNELKLGASLIGAIVFHPASGKHATILGGYWFNDSNNLAYNPFGIVSDTRFNVRDSASTVLNTSWSGSDINEDTHGNGWTFVCLDNGLAGGIDHSGEALEIWVDSSNITELDVTDKSRMSLRHLKIYNDLGNGEYCIDLYGDQAARFWADAGNAVDVSTDNSGSHGLACYGAGTGRGIFAAEIGAKFDVDGVTGAGILEVLKKILDDNGGADFDATTDSLEKIAAAAGGGTVDANLISIGGVTLASGNAVLDLKQVNVINADALSSAINIQGAENGIDIDGGVNGILFENQTETGLRFDSSSAFSGIYMNLTNSQAEGITIESDGHVFSGIASNRGALYFESQVAGSDDHDATINIRNTGGIWDGISISAPNNGITVDGSNLDISASNSDLGFPTEMDISASGLIAINAEMVDVLFTDTIPEILPGTPAKEPTIANGIMLSYMALRNKKTQTQALTELYNDAGIVICDAAYTDDGVTATSEKFVTP